MPDISILIELADFYDVDLREILKGERKAENMDADLKETLEMVADYTNNEKKKIAKSLIIKIGVTALAFVLLGIIVLSVWRVTGGGIRQLSYASYSALLIRSLMSSSSCSLRERSAKRIRVNASRSR